jgi:4-hydroxy-2-oxoglutarate aldolase
MVGTACESTRHTIRKSRRAADMGFPFVSVLTPGYFARQMDGTALEDHYRLVADESSIPLLLYNAPKFAGGVSLTVTSVMRLAEHGNIVGIKDSSSAGPGALLSRLDPSSDFAVLAGSTGFFYPSLLLGAVGGVLSLADYLPGPCLRLYGLFRDEQFGEALELHRRLVRINTGVSGAFGVAGVKAAMDLCGYRGGEPRRPLMALRDEERQKIKTLIEGEGFEIDK